MKAFYTAVKLTPEFIYIRDDGHGTTMSVTNDAEAVVADVIKDFGGDRRILYYDSDGRLDELKHDGTRFTGFAPGPRS